jgi:hypothetical protein
LANLSVSHLCPPQIDVFERDINMMLHYIVHMTSRVGLMGVSELGITVTRYLIHRCTSKKNSKHSGNLYRTKHLSTGLISRKNSKYPGNSSMTKHLSTSESPRKDAKCLRNSSKTKHLSTVHSARKNFICSAAQGIHPLAGRNIYCKQKSFKQDHATRPG